MIQHDLETTGLLIKTDSTDGSRQTMKVKLFNAKSEYAGTVTFYFSSPPEYSLAYCNDRIEPIASPPSEVDKIWEITKLAGLRINLKCNGVTILDILLTDETCRQYQGWKKRWSRDVKQITFDQYDTASDQYRPATEPSNSQFTRIPTITASCQMQSLYFYLTSVVTSAEPYH